MNYIKNHQHNIESISIINNYHSCIRNCLIIISISFIILSGVSTNIVSNKKYIFCSKLISFSFIIISIIICLFSIQEMIENKNKYPKAFKWIFTHVIILIVSLIIFFNLVINYLNI